MGKSREKKKRVCMCAAAIHGVPSIHGQITLHECDWATSLHEHVELVLPTRRCVNLSHVARAAAATVSACHARRHGTFFLSTFFLSPALQPIPAEELTDRAFNRCALSGVLYEWQRAPRGAAHIIIQKNFDPLRHTRRGPTQRSPHKPWARAPRPGSCLSG